MDKRTYQLGQISENTNIFDFDYPIHNEQYRKTFEEHFIDNFYYDEIGLETVAKFKRRLKSKLNLIMPYWNKVLLADELEQRILDNYDVTETYTREVQNKGNIINKNDTLSNNENTTKRLDTETPVTKVDFEAVDFFDNISKDMGNSTTDVKSNNTTTQDGTSTETWTRTMQGNIGVQTDADAVIKYWQSLRQIEIEIFTQCEDLFMGVY